MSVFEVNRLSRDELINELKYRGFTEVGVVECMRKCSRNLLKHEKSADTTYKVPFEVEGKENSDKINEVTTPVTEYENNSEVSL